MSKRLGFVFYLIQMKTMKKQIVIQMKIKLPSPLPPTVGGAM